jgi:tetratricopeptide (TPR) repeat protein
LLVLVGFVLAALTLPKLTGEWYAEHARFALEDKELLESARLARLGLEYQARNPYLYFYLGEANWEQARKLPNPVVARSYAEAALAAYRDALTVFPQDSRTLLQAGWILARLGRFDEAGLMFDSAVTWDPKNGPIRTYQGHYLRLKGDRAAAAAAYRAALALGPNPEAEKSLREIDAAEPR